MSFQNIDQELFPSISNKSIALMVSRALRREHRNDASSVKNISALTTVDLQTIPKWLQSKNAPNTVHLLVLASVYPSILKGVLELIGMPSLWKACLADNIPNKMRSIAKGRLSGNTVYRDKLVRFDVVLDLNIATQLNQRQLWFLGEIQNGNRVNATEITQIWRRSHRTSKRDIRGLVDVGALQFVGASKTGRYILG